MTSSTITRKLIKNRLIRLRRNKNKDDQLHKNAVAGINEWSERHCDSDDVEDLDDGNKLTMHKHVSSPTNVMILITTKNMLKLLKNRNLQLNLDAARGAIWNR